MRKHKSNQIIINHQFGKNHFDSRSLIPTYPQNVFAVCDFVQKLESTFKVVMSLILLPLFVL